jgi:hypothetical protein
LGGGRLCGLRERRVDRDECVDGGLVVTALALLAIERFAQCLL